MKKVKLFLIGVFLLILSVACPVYAAKNPYKATNNLLGTPITNCTYFAWQQAYTKAGVALPGWGNASTWYDSAKKAGFEVGQTPRAKSIVVWSWVYNGKNYGHVGYVERVSGDKIYVWDSDSSCTDQNDPEYKACLSESVSQETDEACFQKYGKRTACQYSASYWSSPGDLIGYIYLDNVPKTTTTTKKSTTKTTTLAKKSDNTYLSKITLSVGEIEFDKDTLEYEVYVDSEVETIKIEATPEDKKAKTNLQEEYKLNVGENKIEIEVTAENETKATYLIKVNRKEKEEVEEVFQEVKKEGENNNFLIYILGCIGILLVTALLIVYVVLMRKKHNK